ncbi:DNA polymerase II large subunit [Candidatus Woesearchaeota archaeon]|nr:DNA polymerase II large subunit [Candidatus Woesearchaeota archaeon]
MTILQRRKRTLLPKQTNMVTASPDMQAYFKELQEKCNTEFKIAAAARAKGYDPDDKVEVQLASNMAERVVGLISVVAPQIVGSGVVERIIDLETQYGALDWRVALQIALEVAQEKFCKFNDKKEAIEVGVRVGFAYGTVGVVSSPLEGLISIDFKQRRDGKGEYFCLNYGGPVRNAGGTAAAWSVIISDYVRKKMGYAEYDPDENEIKRCPTELEDYHERVTNLQYFPSKQESEFMIKSLPVEISGDASETIEVSNYKDLPRIPTNQIRSGYCLIHSSCIPLKAEKLWKQLSKWGKDFDMDQWGFLEEFIKIKKEVHAKGKGAKKDTGGEKPKVTPDFTYIKDLVAGRPIVSHPLRTGGFRLRYGRSRTSGYSAQCIHPASMHVMNDFIATGTQLKVERPGKGAAFTPCDTIEGPTVKLKDGSVARLENERQAKEVKKKVAEVLFLGDALINYGDFLNRNHPLVPPGYCEEWWVQELERKTVSLFGNLDPYKLAEIVDANPAELQKIFKNPLREKPSANLAIRLARETKTPLHPLHTYYWNALPKEKLPELSNWLHRMKIETDERGPSKGILQIIPEQKRNIELMGIPHIVATNEFAVFSRQETAILIDIFKIGTEDSDQAQQKLTELCADPENISTVDVLSKYSGIIIRDKGGIFIGARMGRPEKAKMRKLTGSPHTLFPVGEQGGRLRSFQAALEAGHVTAEFSTYICPSCGGESVVGVCPKCDKKAKRVYQCKMCGTIETNICPKHGKAVPYKQTRVPIKEYFESMLKKMGTRTYPDLIKGVRGTSNREHIPEHLMKGILRAKHDICVNKEGTVRYDASELPITHFRPREIAVSVETLKTLGYTKDVKGRPLENEEQILELKPQDIVLPCCPDSPDEPADKVVMRTANFVDEELVLLYGLKPYYNIQTREDLAGHLVIGLAPHTSAGTLCRIVGFSKTQGFLAHPLMHAAMRRDCDGDETCFILLLDAFLNFSRKYLPDSRGSTMDAPLVLTSVLTPTEVDDMAFDVDRAWNYPLEFYEACLQYKPAWEIKVDTIKSVLNTEQQYEGMGFTHDTDDFNAGVLCSSYKTLPSMQDKLMAQMDLAGKVRAVDESDVARLVIEKHFIRDIKGNLRKFSQQEFRCVVCNEKFRRPPLLGKCTACGGKILFTISEGSIIKYLEPSISLAERYKLPNYLKQSLELTKRRIEGVFGREKEKQTGLGAWFG